MYKSILQILHKTNYFKILSTIHNHKKTFGKLSISKWVNSATWPAAKVLGRVTNVENVPAVLFTISTLWDNPLYYPEKVRNSVDLGHAQQKIKLFKDY